MRICEVNALNCRKTLKPIMPQRRNETNSNATAAKAERNDWMAQGQILNAIAMGNRQPSPEQGKVQRLSRKGVGASAPKWSAPYKWVKI